MIRRIIALSGSKGSGKTTAFNIIKELHPEVIEITFAGKIKRTCSNVFDIPLDHFDNQDLKEVPFDKPLELTSEKLLEVVRAYNLSISIGKLLELSGTELKTPRHIAQFIGTEVLRSLDINVHVNAAFECMTDTGVYVVTDMRFMSEFDYVTALGAKVYHIDNDRAEEAAKGDNHPSELQRHMFKEKCIRLDNNGTLQEFKQLIKGVVK